MKILQRYILKDALYYFGMLMLMVSVIFLAYQMFDMREDIMDNDPSWGDVIQYLMYSMPRYFNESVSIMALFAVIFSVGLMAKNREVIAMVASGISFARLAVPIGLFGLLVTGLAFWLNDYVGPKAQQQAEYLFEVRIKQKNEFTFMNSSDIFRKGVGNRMYIMTSFDSRNNVMVHPTILDRKPDGTSLAQRIDARSAKLLKSPDGKQYWEFKKAVRYTFADDKSVQIERFNEPLQIEMEEKLENFLSRERSVNEMRLGELRDYCQILRKQGGSPQLPIYETAVQSKFTMPLSCLLMALVGFAVAADLRARHFVVVVSTGLLIAIGFYLMGQSLNNMIKNGSLSGMVGDSAPYIAAWLPIVVFSVITFALSRRLATVH